MLYIILQIPAVICNLWNCQTFIKQNKTSSLNSKNNDSHKKHQLDWSQY